MRDCGCILVSTMNPVTVFTSFSPAEAQLVRARLEAAGFHAFVMGELSALSMDGYSMAAGGIRVQVPAKEADEVKEFLAADDAPSE
jgi:hypothetical protein